MEVENDRKYYFKKQRRILVCTIATIIFYTGAWNISELGQIFGFDTYWSRDNFKFLVAVMIVSLIIMCFACGLTVINWRRLPNKDIGIITVALCLWTSVSIGRNLFFLLRQHYHIY